jgi:hypothetical protein
MSYRERGVPKLRNAARVIIGAVLIILSSVTSVAAQEPERVTLEFPNDLVLFDETRDFGFQLGAPAEFVRNHYDSSVSQRTVASFEDPDYELHETHYERFRLMYETLHGTIYLIETSDTSFVTGRGIRVGDERRKVTESYGNPSYVSHDSETGRPIMVYRKHFDEINYEGESAYLAFEISDGMVSELNVYIAQ